MKGPRKGYLFF